MRRRRYVNGAFSAMFFGIASACAFASGFTPSDCVVEMSHSVEMSPIRLGGGFIATPSVGFDAYSPKRAFQKTLYVFDCRTYTEVPVVISEIAHVPLNRIDALMARESEKPIDLVAQLQSVGDGLTLAKVQLVASKFGFKSYINRMAMENTFEKCGCSVHYPELRGDKTSYEASQ